jgi:hypothetical protein
VWELALGYPEADSLTIFLVESTVLGCRKKKTGPKMAKFIHGIIFNFTPFPLKACCIDKSYIYFLIFFPIRHAFLADSFTVQ